MKLAFLFPFTFSGFYKENILPVAASILIGNIKEYFPEVIFSQICLYNDLPFIIGKNDCDKMIDLVYDDVRRSGATVRVLENENIHKRLPVFKEFFDQILFELKLDDYDHYFFAVLDRNIKNFYAHFLLAAYLKKKYPKKKIIFGGLYGIGDTFSNLGRLDFVDSVVTGSGENSVREIIRCLLKSKKLKKKYRINVLPDDRLKGLPDFSSINKLDNFCYTRERLESLYDTKLPKPNRDNKILLLPYRFSYGCFWGKCAYCSTSKHKWFYSKTTDEVVNDLKELKEKYRTRFFIFFNNNFNFNLKYAKELLRKIIKSKLDILWTDSFNLRVIDDELIKLMVKAGCFRADIGMSTLNPKIQKLYDNIFINEYIKNLVKVSLAGIWTHINIISGLPYQYSVDQEIKILIKYIKHIDGVSLYPYLAFRDARLEENYDKFNLKRVEEKIITENKIFIMPFMEKDFKGSVEQRKKMFLESYVKLYNFFLKNKIVPQKLSFNLLGYLYDQLGFARKEEIKEIVNKAGD